MHRIHVIHYSGIHNAGIIYHTHMSNRFEPARIIDKLKYCFEYFHHLKDFHFPIIIDGYLQQQYYLIEAIH